MSKVCVCVCDCYLVWTWIRDRDQEDAARIEKLKWSFILEEVRSQKPHWEQAEVVTAAFCAGKTHCSKMKGPVEGVGGPCWQHRPTDVFEFQSSRLKRVECHRTIRMGWRAHILYSAGQAGWKETSLNGHHGYQSA